jgi:hypothetical protein
MRALSLIGLGKEDFRVSQLSDAYITVDWSSKSSRSPARPSLDLPDLSTTSPGFPYEPWNGTGLERLRQVELQQRNAQETWKVFYAGSVGGQTLTGIPVVCELRDDPELSRYSRVWPFETGFTATPTPHEGPFVLHAEIFPSNLPGSLEEGLIQDRAQVRAVARRLSETDEVGELGSYFATPRALSPERIEAYLQEEGWILGS